MEMVTLTIDGQKVEVPKGSTVLEAAHKANIRIPTLCFLKGINEIGACRMCVVEVKGARALQASCVLPVSEGMEVITNSPAVRESRKVTLELLLSDHNLECPTCVRNLNCELQKLAEELGIKSIRYPGEKHAPRYDDFSPSIVRDASKCILCRRCVSACHKVQGVGVISPNHRGFNTIIAPVFDLSLAEVACVNCGQCIMACPVGALKEKDDTDKVWQALADPDKHVIVQTAPAIRVSLGEEFGESRGAIVTKKLPAALRRLGFDRVFDTDFTADLTIMEEGNEFLERLQHGGKLPLITSCSPGWIKFCEHYYPEFLDNLSTCKSPQQMFGAVAKTYYAQKMGIDPSKIFVVSIMPCTAKKFEAQRPEMNSSGYQDVDVALTTRELSRMLKEAGIDVSKLPDEEFDDPLGISTGAGAIFGATGGVMEAALRTVYEVVTGKELQNIEFTSVRGVEGIKEATIDVDGTKVNVAVAHGLSNARKVLDRVKNGEANYHFIEIMCCPGGCVGGGGQPILSSEERWDTDYREVRGNAIYEVDRSMKLRKSHENPAVQTLYKEFLGKPLSEKSHHLLHTHYTKRPLYPEV
ncbi:MAG: NADP-reducing hydrogenase subunit HndD [Thermoanaerobacteraceae bacterium]|uniref:Ferredoxin n=1 Tax=Biomaibacter acetigenes TaxID=2316383 RepID=A0A3G2R6J3_9FIRM|nr:NADH-dependent [FeFe] hydrogenase, group A6 [Biomaibacter acetigenes]AYO31031.1 ferredoxin [Biomaibacter acetigenes]MDK2877322.1 NADP-reducing hydrogenase subunit HndD [Thermoanaerobacteraceae bacterium]RKL63896.1 ferredoxin [Thermoanaerobacteraceae bacterium SP2]